MSRAAAHRAARQRRRGSPARAHARRRLRLRPGRRARPRRRRCLDLCEQFRRRGILEFGAAPVAPEPAPFVTRRGADTGTARRSSRSASPRWRASVPAGPPRGRRRRRRLRATRRPWRGGRRARRAPAGERAQPRPASARNRAAREAVRRAPRLRRQRLRGRAGLARRAGAVLRLGPRRRRGRAHLGYHRASRLDRYEEVSSPLDMGVRPALRGGGAGRHVRAHLQPPGAPLRLRELGGLREQLRVGEDVDFCWRLRERGHVLVYAPDGVVRHQHRDRRSAPRSGGAPTTALRRPRSTRCTPTSAAASGCRRPRPRPSPSSPPASSRASRGCSPPPRCRRRVDTARRRPRACAAPASACLRRAGRRLHAARPLLGAVLRRLPRVRYYLGRLRPPGSSRPACGCWRRSPSSTPAGSTTRGAGPASACPRIWASTSPSTPPTRPA